MNLDLEILFSSLAFGIAIFFLFYAGEKWIDKGMKFLEKDLAKQLRRMRIPTTSLRKYLSSWLILVTLIFIVGVFGFRMPVLTAGISGLLVGLPWYYVRKAAFNRSMKIEDQLADAMVSLSSSIRAGLSLPQSLEILSKQCPEPICYEFQQIYGEYRMGKTMEVCLDEAKVRLQSENFALFSAAMEASRRSGGKLNETVERIAHSVRELQRLERKIQSETASARASAFYMGLVPFFILGIYYFALDPVSTERLFTTFVGQIILVIAVLLDVIAYFWARHILNQEI